MIDEKRIELQNKLADALCQSCNNHREFLKIVFDVYGRELAFFSHSYFCKKAGFKSRNALREIIAGRRKLTALSYQKIIENLELCPAAEKLFQLLVAEEYPDLERAVAGTPQAIQRQKTVLANSSVKLPAPETVMGDRRYLEVYAAMGGAEHGATLEQLVERTSLRREYISKVVQQLSGHGLVKVEDDHFFPLNSHIFMHKLGGNEYFRSSFMQTLDEISRRQQALFDDRDTFFFQSVYMVKRQNMPDLISALKKTISAYVEDSMVDDGNAIAKLNLSFYA